MAGDSLETGARERLLRAAEAEFSRRGVAGARTREIAATAGVDQKLIGYHFGGKQALYHAVLRRGAETLAAELAPLAELAASDPEQGLHEAIRLVAKTAEQHGDLVRVVLRELLDGSAEELTSTLRAVIPPFSGVLHVLDGFIDQGAVRAVPPALAGIAVAGITTIMAAVPGAATRFLQASTIEERADMIADIVGHGLLPSRHDRSGPKGARRPSSPRPRPKRTDAGAREDPKRNRSEKP